MRKNSEQSDENKQLAASKLHNVRVSTNGARRRAPVGARLCRCEARATLHTLTSVNQRLTPNNSYAKARIGLISNNENHCSSCNSRIGFGTGGSPDGSNTCGNEARYNTDNGDVHIVAMGYIFIQ